MKILQRKKISPVHLGPGDTLQLTYNDGREEKILLTETMTKARVVDVIAMAEATQEELRQLNMVEGLMGIFGKE